MSPTAAMLPEDQFYTRLAIEYSLMRNEEPTFDCVEGDLTRYRGVIVGSGIYEGGFFKVEIVIPREFPFKPPKVIWYTRTWHPNISNSSPAKICESIFNRDWTPSLHVFSVIENLRALLSYPNPDDPLNSSAASEMRRNPSKFKQKVYKYLATYATVDKAFW